MTQLDYSIVRSPNRKKMTITVERDKTVKVLVPEGTADETVRRIVETKRQWLLAKLGHPQKYQGLAHAPGKEVVNGESALYLGKEYRIEISETLSGNVEFTDGFLVPKLHQANRRNVLRGWYLDQAKELILPLVEKRAAELGVVYGNAQIIDARYRWGSCTPAGNLRFNWRLIKAPMFVINYVVVHELAHLLEPNHTERFWSIVRTNVTTLEKAKGWLKEHGGLLEEEL